MKNGIIFDLDGTLWDSSKQVVPAWNVVLKRYPELHKQITLDDMHGYMGKTVEHIAEIMFPDMEVDKRIDILQECCKGEVAYLKEHGGTLYSNLEAVLSKLKEKYSLSIVSNCQDGYVQVFLEYHDLGKYFDDYEMSGRTGMSKGENIKLIIERNKLDKAVYVGDTTGDQEAAAHARVPFICAEYGFGNVSEPDYLINSIEELPKRIDGWIK